MARPPELSWHDTAVYLLHVAAEIEHALMVQYLYAAYSVGGPGVGGELHERARAWREVCDSATHLRQASRRSQRCWRRSRTTVRM